MKKTITVLAALLTLTLSAACSSSNTPTSASGSKTSHNSADVQFAQEMIPHHRQAVQMAKMAATQAGSAEVKSLAKDIEAAQGPEINTMSGWLKSWGESIPSDKDPHAGMSGMAMPGMMSTEDMNKMKAATGAQFDTMFLTMMIAHHEGAIEMAKIEQQKGKSPDAKKLAAEIEKTQATEIDTMNKLLKNS